MGKLGGDGSFELGKRKCRQQDSNHYQREVRTIKLHPAPVCPPCTLCSCEPAILAAIQHSFALHLLLGLMSRFLDTEARLGIRLDDLLLGLKSRFLDKEARLGIRLDAAIRAAGCAWHWPYPKSMLSMISRCENIACIALAGLP